MCSVSYMMHACSNCGCVPESYTNAECMSAPFHASHGPSVPHMNVNRTSTWCIVYGARHSCLYLGVCMVSDHSDEITGVAHNQSCISGA